MSGWRDRRESGAGDTIFALSTPPGRSAVAVIRLSGPRAGEAVTILAGRRPQPRQAMFSRLREPGTGERLDEGIVLWFPAPASFTGEDCAEIQIHGSIAGIAAVLRTLASLDNLREARPGEFTERALANGKLDLNRVEALADLIDAQTDAQRRLALRAADEGPAKLAEVWRDAILDFLAEIESRLDFSDEGDVDLLQNEALGDRIKGLAETVDLAIAGSERAGRIRQGFVMALCGPPNSGKSTLLNALVGREQAIVSPHAGTTRDTIEVVLDLRGLLVTIVDTAGIRDTADPVEAIGVERARRAARQADFTIWLDAPDARAEPDLPVDLRIGSKADMAAVPEGSFAISAATGINLDRLVDIIAERAAGDARDEGLGTLRERHIAFAQSVVRDLTDAVTHVRGDRLELAAAHLRGALASIEGLGSKSADEDVLDRIFGRFCIGK